MMEVYRYSACCSCPLHLFFPEMCTVLLHVHLQFLQINWKCFWTVMPIQIFFHAKCFKQNLNEQKRLIMAVNQACWGISLFCTTLNVSWPWLLPHYFVVLCICRTFSIQTSSFEDPLCAFCVSWKSLSFLSHWCQQFEPALNIAMLTSAEMQCWPFTQFSS